MIPRKPFGRVPENQQIIYVVRCDRFIKIGLSNWRTFAERFSHLQIGNPLPLTVCNTFVVPADEQGKVLEARSHAIFDPYWERGEWFRLEPIPAQLTKKHALPPWHVFWLNEIKAELATQVQPANRALYRQRKTR
jgi:hypothetical protein